MHLTKFQKFTRSVEGNYMFSCPPRMLYKPISISASINDKKISEEEPKITGRSVSKTRLSALRRSGNLRRGSKVWSSKDFYDPSPIPFEPTVDVENKILAQETHVVQNRDSNLAKTVECQTENSLTPAHTNDVAVQISELIVDDFSNLEYESEVLVTDILNDAFANVLSSKADGSALGDVICPRCKDNLHIQSNLKAIQESQDYGFVTIKTFSQGFMDQLVPSLLQKLEDNGFLRQTVHGVEDFGSFLPWFLEEFNREASKLQSLCKKMEESLKFNAMYSLD